MIIVNMFGKVYKISILFLSCHAHSICRRIIVLNSYWLNEKMISIGSSNLINFCFHGNREWIYRNWILTASLTIIDIYCWFSLKSINNDMHGDDQYNIDKFKNQIVSSVFAQLVWWINFLIIFPKCLSKNLSMFWRYFFSLILETFSYVFFF